MFLFVEVGDILFVDMEKIAEGDVLGPRDRSGQSGIGVGQRLFLLDEGCKLLILDPRSSSLPS